MKNVTSTAGDGETDIVVPSQKTVALLSTGLDLPTALNVIGHLSIALGVRLGAGLVQSPDYRDRSGTAHLGLSAWPLIMLKTRPAKLRRAIAAARLCPELTMTDYPREVLTTRSDAGLAAALAATAELDLEYLGAMVHGTVDAVDALFATFALIRDDSGRTI